MGPLLGAFTVAVLSDQDSRAYSPLPCLVDWRHLIVIQEGEQFLLVPPQSLLRPPGMFLLPPMVDEFG